MVLPSFTLVLFTISLIRTAFASFYTDPAELGGSYDFIIVGAGTAGNVVARRLAENASVSVLVIEAGGTNEGIVLGIVPLDGPQMTPNQPWNWNYTTTPQSGLANRTFAYPRGRLLGGSSSVNYMIYTRGSTYDYDRIANVSGDSAWSWSSLWNDGFVLKSERFLQPTDHHNTTGEYDPAYHGYDGLINTTLSNQLLDFHEICIKATGELPTQYPFNLDQNSGDPLGVGWAASSTGGGVRSSSATGYLETVNLTNMDILMDSTVTQLIYGSPIDGVPTVSGVQVQQVENGTIYSFFAKTEVILSAGAINTPQILMLSGIGNAAELEQFDISVVKNLSEVGYNLQDHPLLASQWYVNTTDTFDQIGRNATLAQIDTELYDTNQTGPFANNVAGVIGWLRLPKDDPIFENTTDPSSGPTAPHYELAFGNGFIGVLDTLPATGNFLTIVSVLITPTSRGTVKLSSSNPFDYPLIDVGFLQTDFDQTVMREAFQSGANFLTAPAFEGYIGAPYGPVPGPNATDAEIDDYVTNWTTSIWHPTATAAISAWDATTGVVNPDLTVKGVNNLRIVDASVFPFVPAGHPQAAIYIIAEKAASIIQNEYNI